jgi:hypothetical protein
VRDSAEVDDVYARVTAAGFHGEKEPGGTRSGDSGTLSSGTPTACPWISTPRSAQTALWRRRPAALRHSASREGRCLVSSFFLHNGYSRVRMAAL